MLMTIISIHNLRFCGRARVELYKIIETHYNVNITGDKQNLYHSH